MKADAYRYHNGAIDEVTLAQIKRIAPRTCLDAGAGRGYYGVLVKQLFQSCEVTAVELNQGRAQRLLDLGIYLRVLWSCIGKALIEKDLRGDLIIFGDVLEHMDKPEALDALREGRRRFNHVIVNTPLGFWKQRASNPEDRHRCGFVPEDFSEFRTVEMNIRYRRHYMLNVWMERS